MTTARTSSPGRPPERHDRFPPPFVGSWCAHARDDPITGLVAWPGFFAQLPRLMEEALRYGQCVGLAIGDVDDLKSYVEDMKARDAQSFGHLAGNAFMGRLGTIARNWLHADSVHEGCLATFGGDEVVLASVTKGGAAFLPQVHRLRDALRSALPRTVAFAATVIEPQTIPGEITGDHWWREFCVHEIGRVERALFENKEARRRGHQEDSIVAV
ncbi:MAG: diguanylate cyclase [Propionibacteriales bacterium]|nr:diguanylate cyclase [Propionibacteriales bacterium]